MHRDARNNNAGGIESVQIIKRRLAHKPNRPVKNSQSVPGSGTLVGSLGGVPDVTGAITNEPGAPIELDCAPD